MRVADAFVCVLWGFCCCVWCFLRVTDVFFLTCCRCFVCVLTVFCLCVVGPVVSHSCLCFVVFGFACMLLLSFLCAVGVFFFGVLLMLFVSRPFFFSHTHTLRPHLTFTLAPSPHSHSHTHIYTHVYTYTHTHTYTHTYIRF